MGSIERTSRDVFSLLLSSFDQDQTKRMNEDDSVPYYRDYTNNAIRGAITAACFATFFLIIAVINHFRWKPEKDGDSLNEYNLHCEEKEDTEEKDIVQTFDTEKLAEERVLVERCAEQNEEVVENEEMGKDNLGLED